MMIRITWLVIIRPKLTMIRMVNRLNVVHFHQVQSWLKMPIHLFNRRVQKCFQLDKKHQLQSWFPIFINLVTLGLYRKLALGYSTRKLSNCTEYFLWVVTNKTFLKRCINWIYWTNQPFKYHSDIQRYIWSAVLAAGDGPSLDVFFNIGVASNQVDQFLDVRCIDENFPS